MAKVKKHTAIRSGKTVVIPEHTRTERGRNLPRSSCINRVSINSEGNRIITIRGKEYPYNGLDDARISGLVSAKSAGKYYNKHIRGKTQYF